MSLLTLPLPDPPQVWGGGDSARPVAFAAFRWETFRIQRIYRQDPRRRDVRSPAEFHSLRRAWQELQSLFVELESVDDLPTRLDLPGRKHIL